MMNAVFMLIALLALGGLPALAAEPRVVTPLDDGWRFHLGDPADAAKSKFDDSAWTAVRVPHDFQPRASIGWYRRQIELQEGLHFYLEFGAASITADVYLDGDHLATHRGAFAAFRVRVPATYTPVAHTLAVRVSNHYSNDVPNHGDYTVFGGLYRPARLIAVGDVSLDLLDHGGPGAYFTTATADAKLAKVSALVRLRNHADQPRRGTVQVHICDDQGNSVVGATAAYDLAAAAAGAVPLQLEVKNPRLWQGRSDPYRYRASVEVKVGETIVDRITQPLGLRTVALDAQRGFLLNGKVYDLRGVNRHQEIGDEKWAVSPQNIDDDFAMLIAMGCTGVRLVHYQHSDYVHEVCDKLGLVAWVESPVNTRIQATPEYAASAKQQFQELIRQTHNHPAVCILAAGNEVRLARGPDPSALVAEMLQLAQREAPGRVYSIAAKGGNPADAGLSGIGINIYRGWYGGTPQDFGPFIDQQRARYAPLPVGVTEYGAGASINYHSLTPKAQDYTEEWQAYLHEVHLQALRQRPWLWCKFAWLGFDTSGARKEADTPGQNNKGLITRNRQVRKDAYYLYQAHWTDQPMVYITSRRFTPRKQALTPVKVYANVAEVELRVNGVALGTRKVEDHIAVWPEVQLRAGKNQIEARAGNVSDACAWVVE